MEPALVFHHNHKAGGTSIKTAFERTLCKSPRSCIWFEANRSKLILGRGSPKDAVSPDYLFTASMEERMKLRVIVATDNLWTGVCSFLPRRCVYFTTMRSPLYQHISFWNFLCVAGKQNHSGWNATELRLGRCERSLTTWPKPFVYAKLAGYHGPRAKHYDETTLALEKVEQAKVNLGRLL